MTLLDWRSRWASVPNRPGLAPLQITSAAPSRSTRLGANLTGLEYTNDQLAVQKTNIDAAKSAIKEVVVAQESTS